MQTINLKNMWSVLPSVEIVHPDSNIILSYQLKLIKMLAELANLNNCAVPFLSRAVVNHHTFTVYRKYTFLKNVRPL